MSSPKAGPLGIVTDVGGVRIPGSTRYDPAQQSYTLTGAGENVWGVADQLHFAGFTVHGDFILTAECALRGTGGNPHRKVGLTLRQTLDGSSVHADAAVHGDGLTSLQYREQTGAETREMKAPFSHADILQLGGDDHHARREARG
jgi:TolB protein